MNTNKKEYNKLFNKLKNNSINNKQIKMLKLQILTDLIIKNF